MRIRRHLPVLLVMAVAARCRGFVKRAYSLPGVVVFGCLIAGGVCGAQWCQESRDATGDREGGMLRAYFFP